MASPNSDNPPKDLSEERRARRQLRKSKREEDKLRKQISDIRAPKTDKIKVISTETYQSLQRNSGNTTEVNRKVKNKHFRAVKTQFALEDFVVKKPDKKYTPKRVSGTTVPHLKRGKVREVPKQKTLSKLKKAILEIRRKRKKEVEETNAILQVENPSQQMIPPVTQESIVGPISYSRKFRSYCDHFNKPEAAESAEKLLRDLFRFQDRAFEKNQIKARAHKRYVIGFKEVERNLVINKIKLLLIATDLEPSPGVGGLDEAVQKLKDTCIENNVPYCFPLQRRKMGYLLFKKAPISCVGILDYDGAEDHVKDLMKCVNRNRSFLNKEIEKLRIN